MQIPTGSFAASASDEGVPRAQSGYMPKVTAQANSSFGTDARTPSLASDQSTRSGGYSVMLSQPIFDGGRTSSAVREAAANAGASAKQAGSSTEVMVATVTAYVDVRQDRQIVRINEQNVAALEVTARAARRRKGVSEATVADVSQAEAALAGGRAELELATSTLSADEAAFEATVLHPPTALESPPSILHLMPKDRSPRSRCRSMRVRKSLPLCFEPKAHVIGLNGPERNGCRALSCRPAINETSKTPWRSEKRTASSRAQR